jgi:hypothetical protein
MFCLNCKSTIPESAKFCTMCGAKVNVSLCPNGHVLEPGEIICRYCPSAAGQDNSNRISVSTTIEKLSYPGEVPLSVKPTAVESEPEVDPGASSSFGSTRIFLEKEEDPVGVLGWLVIIDGADKWKDFKITKRKLTMGRSRDCDIVLEHSQVSAKHASIRLLDDGLFLTDLDSSNGTFVNDQVVVKQKLIDNDFVKIGDITMKFKAF